MIQSNNKYINRSW